MFPHTRLNVKKTKKIDKKHIKNDKNITLQLTIYIYLSMRLIVVKINITKYIH